MKVKTFTSNNLHELELKINNFLTGKEYKNIIDIKFQNTSDYTEDYCSAMIIYEEKENKSEYQELKGIGELKMRMIDNQE